MAVNALLSVLAVAGLVLAAPVHKASTMNSKSLAGPPEEFESHSIPASTMAALSTESAAYFITLANAANGMPTWTRKMSVDSATGFSLQIFSPLEEITVTLVDPKGATVDLSKFATPV
jgi:hypothetical protein